MRSNDLKASTHDRIPSREFDKSTKCVATHLWVTNNSGNSVTELNASDASWVRTFSGGSFGFCAPWGVAFEGTHLWVTNNAASSVTEHWSH